MITLASPLWLLLLGLAVPLTALHAFRRKTISVPSAILWRQVAGQHRSRPRFARPRLTWPLALQLLALALLAVALSQPHFGARAPARVIYLVDTSAPMQTVDAGGDSRIAAARARLQVAVAEDMLRGTEVSVISVGAVATPLAKDHNRQSGIAPLIATLDADDGAADWQGARHLVAAIATGDTTKTRIEVITGADTPVAGTDFASLGIADIAVTRIGSGGAAALALEGRTDVELPTALRPRPEGGQLLRLQGRVTAQNGAELPTALTLRFYPYGRSTGGPDLGTVALSRDTEGNATFNSLQVLSEPGMVALSLPEDATPQDNALYFDTLMGWPAKVLLVAEPAAPTYDEDGTEIPPDDSVARAIAAVFGAPDIVAELPDTATQAQYDLVVVDDLTLAARPAGNVIWLNRAGVAGETPAPAASGSLISWSTDHPATAGLPFNQLDVQRFHPMPALEGGAVLASVGEVPVISARRLGGGAEMRIALDPAESGWTKGPMLLRALLGFADWAGIGPKAQIACAVGQSCTLPAHLATGPVITPDGETLTPPPVAADAVLPESMARFTPLHQGLYRLADGRPLVVAGAVATQVTDTADEEAAPAPTGTTLVALGPWLLLLALVVLGAEMARAWRLGQRGALALGLRVAAMAAIACGYFGLALPALTHDPARRLVAGADPDMPLGLGERIALALAEVRADAPARLLLEDTGFDPRDDAARALPAFAARATALDVVATEAVAEDGPRILALDAPRTARAGDRVALTLQIENLGDAPVTRPLMIARDGKALVTQDQILAPGVTRIDTAVPADAAGLMRLAVTLGPEGPSTRALVEIKDAPRALVIASDTDWGDYLAEALALQGIESEVIPPVRAPILPDRWLERDLIILADVPAQAMPYAKLEQIENAVRAHGRTLMILGGPNAFGPGGYFATPLEALSPLSAKVPQEAPRASVAFVVDRSGSMLAGTGTGRTAASRLDVARAATISAATTLDAESSVAIVAFDAAAHLMLPLTEGVDAEAMTDALKEVTPGGGTALLPALDMAIEVLATSDLPLRHIVVITDGQVEDAPFAPTIARAKAAGVTISSIGIGPTARVNTLGQLAEEGGGSFHSARDIRSLPSILAQEAMSLAGDPVESGTRTPYWAGALRAPVFAGLPQDLPPLDAYVLTTLREGADLHIALEDDSGMEVPVMASWRQGAGQVLAFASQGAGGGVDAWMRDPAYPRFWAQIARQMLPDMTPLGLSVMPVRIKDRLEITLHRDLPIDNSLAEDATGTATLTLIAPDGTRQDLPLTRSGDFDWRAGAVVDQTGLWRITARHGIRTASTSVYIPAPAVTRAQASDAAGLATLAAATGGARHTAATLPPAPSDTRIWRMNPARSPWVLLGLALLLADIAARYMRRPPARPRS